MGCTSSPAFNVSKQIAHSAWAGRDSVSSASGPLSASGPT
eukprot:CAMPEP_0180801466 /NCGR_PEP_ID=MMETSP1038_2-20121128/59677_1 /TAXON_ID=632150 /ORGANISM="Azadinium spinosum, Strain 3D9" /LENGTH=39 /DNA_ID= /DNA_START= /DNA_END= /DNA_ORIENTATION=